MLTKTVEKIVVELTFQKIVDFPKLSVLYQVRHTVNKTENFSIGQVQKVTFKKTPKMKLHTKEVNLTTKSINQYMKRNISHNSIIKPTDSRNKNKKQTEKPNIGMCKYEIT